MTLPTDLSVAFEALAPQVSFCVGKGMCVGESTAGLVLLTTSLKPVYANTEAMQIFAYPEAPPSIRSFDIFLAHMVRSVLGNGSGVRTTFPAEFISGRRHYLCRIFSLDSDLNLPNCLSDQPTLALILERGSWSSVDVSRVAAKFRLTPRELETLKYVICGLTNKEIGQRMNISANTVKAFLRFLMTKMDATTRSGVVGKTISLAPTGDSTLAPLRNNAFQNHC
jgi:DNA-binding CsgD family transcriptional regulator